MKAPKNQAWLIVLGLLIVLTLGRPALAQEPSKILILPFNVYSEKDISFLKNGIWDMLSTRLYNDGATVILDKGMAETAVEDLKGPVDEKAATDTGEKIGADYVIFGSLTIFGDTVSTDAKFIHVPSRSAKVTFNRSGTKHGDVILHVNEFAEIINETVFGAAPKVIPAPPKTENISERRMNPELMWKREQGRIPADETPTVTPPQVAAPVIQPPTGPAAPAPAPMPAPKPVAPGSAGLWKTPEFGFRITAMATGDVDGDGIPEVVFASQRDIHIYHITGSGVESFSVVKGKRSANLISIDVADINQNGRAEIFATNFQRENAVNNSFVLEWNGRNIVTLAEKQNWYFRVLKGSGGSPMLLGQTRNSEDEFFSGPVRRLAYQNGGYEAVAPVNIPRGLSIYAFALGDALNNRREQVITYGTGERIKVIGSTGTEDFTSDDAYGGGGVMLEFPRDRKVYADEEDRYYIPQRFFVADLDNDGRNELVAVKNIDSAGRLFKRFHLYNTSRIEALQWNDLGFEKKMETKEISGYIADYAVVDFNRDGQKELIYAVVKGGSLFGKAKSFIAHQVFHISPQ